MASYSIVIPAYNQWALVHQLLWDIHQNCFPVGEVLVVDDVSSDEGFLNGISWWVSNGMLPVQHLRMKTNQGFLKTSNYGLKKATQDIAVLISTDVRIHTNILQSLDVVNNTSPKWLAGGRLLNFDTGWNRWEDRLFPYLEGWLLAARKDGWEELGYLDERFAPHDYEDVDLSTSAIQKEYVLHSLELDARLEHLGGRSIGYNPEREKLTHRNRKIFEEKWLKDKVS